MTDQAIPPGVTGLRIVDAALDKAVSVPSSAIHRHVDKIRARHPEATPADVVAMLERQYVLAISASGGAVGVAAAAPAVGTGTALALTSSEVATFFAASAAFSLAVADVHGIAVTDTARRRALVLASVLGDQGARTVSTQAGLSPTGWARALLLGAPTRTIARVNNALAKRFIRRQVARQGGLALGRLVPFGIGAAIGIAGARALGATVVVSTRRAFGPPPVHFPRMIELPPAEPRRRLTHTDDDGAPTPRLTSRVRRRLRRGTSDEPPLLLPAEPVPTPATPPHTRPDTPPDAPPDTPPDAPPDTPPDTPPDGGRASAVR